MIDNEYSFFQNLFREYIGDKEIIDNNSMSIDIIERITKDNKHRTSVLNRAIKDFHCNKLKDESYEDYAIRKYESQNDFFNFIYNEEEFVMTPISENCKDSIIDNILDMKEEIKSPRKFFNYYYDLDGFFFLLSLKDLKKIEIILKNSI